MSVNKFYHICTFKKHHLHLCLRKTLTIAYTSQFQSTEAGQLLLCWQNARRCKTWRGLKWTVKRRVCCAASSEVTSLHATLRASQPLFHCKLRYINSERRRDEVRRGDESMCQVWGCSQQSITDWYSSSSSSWLVTGRDINNHSLTHWCYTH